jgi:hypothetical protein
VPDGRLLLPAVRAARAAGDASTALPGLDRGDATAVGDARTAAEDWLAAAEAARAVPAGQPPAAWRPERLDYEFAVAAPAGGGTERVLVAGGHRGGRLDWWSLDAQPGGTLGAAADPGLTTVRTSGLPSRVGGAGLPAARFWELESGDVNLDAVTAAPEDLGRLLFMEFAVVYGSEFFAVPLEVDVGSVTSVRSLAARTTFGETVTVPAAEQVDAAAGRAPFRLFRPSVAGDPTAAETWLVVLPTVLGGLAGPPVEEVLFSRDEMANVAWAIERIVPGVDGRGTDRAEALHRATAQPPLQSGEPGPPAQRYRLVTAVPANWLPMLPATAGPAGAGRPVLRLSGPQPAGTLLTPGAELHAERLDRAGIRLSRQVERARAADGRPLSWISRRTYSGRGDSSSGLRFDDLVGPS